MVEISSWLDFGLKVGSQCVILLACVSGLESLVSLNNSSILMTSDFF